MIITKTWLNEFIDLRKVSNKKLYETFNSIGLEVDSINTIEISDRVVVGKILSCEKHPDADKLNVCQIDVGSGCRQIVCGAANVVDAKYVAVATIGAVLPGDFEIKHAKLRGVESEGMVCASSELGLPDMGKGIMILDDSIGKLVSGRPLNQYSNLADTIIELELTANRGDCLSVYGVARDLSAALEIDMKPFEFIPKRKMTLGIARVAEIRPQGNMLADLYYKLIELKSVNYSFLLKLRLAMVGIDSHGNLASILSYTTHSTGVVLRAYDSSFFRQNEKKITVIPKENNHGLIEITGNDKHLSTVGVNQNIDSIATDDTQEIIIEASYINPETLVSTVSSAKLKKDDLYYQSSRGTNPALEFGISFFSLLMHKYTDMLCYEGSLNVNLERENNMIVVNSVEVSEIVGMEIKLGKIVTILQKLGFKISKMSSEAIAVSIPLFRHDIKHIQDIAEEVVRIIGIKNIKEKPLSFTEKPRLNITTDTYKIKKVFKNNAVGAGFYQNVSYVFSDKELLEKYGFAITGKNLELVNPIAKELNTLRSTILVNLLMAVKRNVSYSQKSIPLFEIGSVFGAKREEKEVMSFIFSGQIAPESIANSGKPKMIYFAKFIEKITAVIGEVELVPCTFSNGLIHPYHSANIVKAGKVCGFVSKLHPNAQESFDIPDTFIAEIDFESIYPKHINAVPISNFQGVYKDLSVVINKKISYYEVSRVIDSLNLTLLRDSYPVDIYEDEALGENKSLSIRFFIQSIDRTLEDKDVEMVMKNIMSALKNECNATLR